MLLSSLEPEFVAVDWDALGHPIARGLGLDSTGAQGISFRCPASGHTHRIVLWFSNPFDSVPPAPLEFKPTPRWQRIGQSLATITLSPSVNIPGHWSGFIILGDVR